MACARAALLLTSATGVGDGVRIDIHEERWLPRRLRAHAIHRRPHPSRVPLLVRGCPLPLEDARRSLEADGLSTGHEVSPRLEDLRRHTDVEPGQPTITLDIELNVGEIEVTR